MITKKSFAGLAFIFAACAVFTLSSCGNKSNNTANADDEYVTVSTPVAGYTIIADKADSKSLGLKKGTDVLIDPSSDFVSYTKIEYDAALQGFKLYKDATKYVLADMTGHIIRDGAFDKITRDEDGSWYRLYSGELIGVYSPKAKHSWGMYEECKTEKGFVFAKQSGKWGCLNLDESLYMEKQYDKIYVVNYKSEKEFNVFALKDGNWAMFDAKGAEYDTSSAEIKGFLGKRKLSEPVGILDINF